MRIPRPYNFKLKGRAKEVFKMLELLAKTVPEEQITPGWTRAIVVYFMTANKVVPGQLLRELYEKGKVLWCRK